LGRTKEFGGLCPEDGGLCPEDGGLCPEDEPASGALQRFATRTLTLLSSSSDGNGDATLDPNGELGAEYGRGSRTEAVCDVTSDKAKLKKNGC